MTTPSALVARARAGRPAGIRGAAPRRARLARAMASTLLLAWSAGGCDGERATASAPRGATPGGSVGEPGAARVVAVVGTRTIRADTVAAIAAAQGIDPPAATEQAIVDALCALGAESDGLGAEPGVSSGLRGVLARATLHALASESAAGAISDEELAAATERRWLEVDRPPAFRTVHAVVLVNEKTDDAQRARAAALAARWRQALATVAARVAETPAPAATDATPIPAAVADDAIGRFAAAVRALDAGGLEVRVEPLPAVTCDGRVVADDAPGQRFDESFARAACALATRGALSPVTTSPFGLHVIMLLDVVPPKRVDEAQRRRLLHDDILTHRAREAHRALLERLRAQRSVERPPNLDALLRLVGTER